MSYLAFNKNIIFFGIVHFTHGYIKERGGDKHGKTTKSNSIRYKYSTSETTKCTICRCCCGQGQFGTEFASETDVQEVRQRNQQAEANKAKNSGQFGGQNS